jgi:NAD(P)-dependent dehydrogenase (short-subunit alcohol dehydrogenase family)
MYLDKLRLDGRVAFVTGGAQGIGYAAAEALVEAGAQVVIGDLSESQVAQAAASLGAASTVLDVTDSAQVAAVAARSRPNAAASTY